MLWYATGGVAWTKVSFSGHESFIFESMVGERVDVDIVPVSKTAVGATAGVGFEFAVTDRVTLGLEGRYTWYGSQHFDTVAIDPASAPGSLNLNTAEIIGKVNWKFGGNEEPRERR